VNQMSIGKGYQSPSGLAVYYLELDRREGKTMYSFTPRKFEFNRVFFPRKKKKS